MAKEYVCDCCKGTFELLEDETWSDEKAVREMNEAFGKSLTRSDCAIVCDDCYQKMNPANHPDLVEKAVKETLEGRRTDVQ